MKPTVSTIAIALLAGVGLWGASQNALAVPQSQDLACAPQSESMPLEGRVSPYDSTMAMVGSGMVKICYSRPSLRGRVMVGGEAVPYGQVWRTGANEPTTLHVNVPVRIAGIEVGPGSYSVYTIPDEGDAWTLIVNASTDQWGHEGAYSGVMDQDVGRTPVEAEMLEESVEQFTIRPMEMGSGFVMEWQNTRVHVPIDPA